MKRLLSFAIAVIFALQSLAQTTITIGDSTSSQQTSYAPVSYAYHNSYSQTIYPASSLISGGIVSLSYYCSAINATPEGTIKIYMAEVSSSSLTGFMTGVDFVEVFSGPIQWLLGWNQIMLTTPFVYTGTGNLLIATIRDGNTWSASNQYKASFALNSVVYNYADDIEYDVNNSQYGTVAHNRPIIQLQIAELDDYCYPVTDLRVDTETLETNSATISWNVMDESSTTFGLAYKTDSPSSTWTTIDEQITDLSYTLTGLNPYTRYQVKVWTICNFQNSIEEFTDFVTLPTDDLLLSIPHTQNFDDLSEVTEWQFSNNGVNQWHIGSAIDNTTLEVGGNALYISNDNGATNNYTNSSISVSHAYTLVEIEEGSYYGISFDLKFKGESTAYETDYFTVSLLPLVEELSTSMPNANRIIAKVLTTNDEWERINIQFPHDLEPTVYHLVFSWRNNDSNGQNPAAAVDNLNIFSTPCARVNDFNVRMENAGESVSMILEIIDSLNTNAEYIVDYRISGDTAWNSIQGTNPIEIIELPYSTKIDYRVSSICSGNLAVVSDMFSVWTICSSIYEFPYVENFDTNVFVAIQDPMKANKSAFNCWYNVNGGANSYSWDSISSGSGVNSTSALYFSGDIYSASYAFSDWFISPVFELTGNERLNFEYKTLLTDNAPIIDVFAMNVSGADYSSMADTSNFTLIARINTQAMPVLQYNMAEVYLNGYSGSTRLALAIREQSAPFYIDNFSISEMQTCSNVYGFTVSSGLQSANINYNTANLSEEGVVIAYSPMSEGEFNPELATTITIPSNATMPYTIEGLTAGVSYNFAAKQACGGEWTNVLSVEIPNAYPVPLYFDFDTPTTTPAMSFTSSSQENAWWIGSAENNTVGANGDFTFGGALYVSNDNGTTASYTEIGDITNAADASFMVYLTPMAGRVLSFDVKVGGEFYNDYVSVFLVPYGQAFDNSYLLEGFLCQIPSWQTRSLELPSDYSGLYSLVFRWVNNNTGGAQPGAIIDNIRITQPNCNTSAVNWAVNSMENENDEMTLVVNLSDSENVGATYKLAYRQANETAYTEVTGLTINDFPYTINGVNHQTTYNVRLSLLCSEEENLLVDELSLTTPCQSIPTPWFEDFSTSPYTSACWERYSEPMPSNGIVYTSSLMPSNSSFCWGHISMFACGITESAMLRSEIYYGSNNWIFTPIIDLGNDSTIKQISFDLGLRNYMDNLPPATSDHGKIMLLVSFDNGVSWDKSNGLLFVDGDADLIHNYSDLTNVMQRFSYKLVDENNEPLTGKVRFAFYSESPTAFNYNWVCLDNIAVEQWSECPSPYGISVSEITSNTANVFFQSNDDVTSWEYVVVESSGEEANLNNTTPIQLSTTSIALTDLHFSTEYTIGIRSVCEDSSSPWATATFTTLAAIESLPYFTSFDDEDDAATWFFTQNLNPNSWAIGTATATEEGGSAAYISNDNGATYSASLAPVTTLAYIWKDFAFGETENNYVLSFDWKIRGRATGAYCGIIVYLTDVVEPPTNGLPADSDALTLIYGEDDWTNKTIFMGNVRGDKRLVILSFGYSSPEELVVPAAIDNVSIDIVSCAPPTSEILVTDLTAESATITWVDEEHTSWNVYYKTSSESTYTSVSVSSPTLTLTQLIPDVAYNVYVTAICDTEESSPSAELTFRTLCAPLVAPFDYDFETFVGSACWTKATGLLTENVTLTNGSYYWNTSTNNVDGNSSLKLRSNVYGTSRKDWVITPQIDLGEGELYQVSIDVALTRYGNTTLAPSYSSDDRFAIVVSEDGGLTWSNTNALIFANSDADTEHNYSDFSPTFTRVSFELRDINGEPLTGLIKIAFYTESTIDDGADNDLYIDNLSIEIANDEPAPCDAPTLLSASNITASTAQITWNATADAYEFKLNNGQTETLTTTTKELTGLTPATTYTIEVRAICGEQISEWTTSTFTTLSSLNETITNQINATLYPNPASLQATLQINGLTQDAKIVISDIQGRILNEDAINAGTSRYTINLSDMAKGVYYIRILTDKAILTQKLIVE